ncbi:MAG TPA: hypothetical protein VHC19_16090 [Pirellulales bacterium]|nr:hypothetical protein [Pirellulales bacterium]
MPRHRIAYLGLLDGDRACGDTRGEDHLRQLAAAVTAAEPETWEIEIISCGPEARLQTLEPGVTRRVLQQSVESEIAWDASSWELPAALRAADAVHLHDGYSRTCELGLLIARQQQKPVCLTDYGVTANWLTNELELGKLADAIICHEASAAEKAVSPEAVELLPAPIDLNWFGVPAEWPSPCFLPPTRPRGPALKINYGSLGRRLAEIYRGLLVGREEVAA